jgi:putative ABC transport system permease protein
LLLAFWGRDLIGLLEPSSLTRFHDIPFDGRVLGFTVLASGLTTILFGLWPAWQASRADVQLALKSGGHGSSDTPALRRIRDLLVILDVALTLVLLSSAALVLRSFAHMQAVSLGFDPNRLTTAKLDLPYVNYSDKKALQNFCENLTSKVAALPGVTHVALAANPPLQQSWQEPFIREGVPPAIPGQEPGAETVTISGDYFGAMAAPLLRGRTFSSRDDASAPLVVIIDQTLGEKYFPGEDPIGKRLITDAGDTDGVSMRPFEIVGVAPRMKFHGADTTRKLPVIYFSEVQVGRTSLVLFVRGASGSLESSLREIVSSLDSRQPVHDVRTMSSLVEETWSTQRLLSSLLSIFAGLSLLLATVGLYGVLSYNAARRFREFGLRFALGARRADIRRLIFGHGFRLLIAGSVLGLVVAAAASTILRSVLFEISVAEPVTYFSVSAVLAGATLIACWLPAARACRIDPASALRSE